MPRAGVNTTVQQLQFHRTMTHVTTSSTNLHLLSLFCCDMYTRLPRSSRNTPNAKHMGLPPSWECVTLGLQSMPTTYPLCLTPFTAVGMAVPRVLPLGQTMNQQ